MIEHPNLTATATTKGVKAGVPGGTTLTPGGSSSIPGTPKFNALPSSPLTSLQQRHRPPTFLDFHERQKASPEQASRDLDAAIGRSFENSYRLETMIATTQHGAATVIGSVLGIPTGLSSVQNATGSISSSGTPHNFTVSVDPSQIPGAVDIHVFQPLSKTDNTPVTSTTPVVIRWNATGSITSP